MIYREFTPRIPTNRRPLPYLVLWQCLFSLKTALYDADMKKILDNFVYEKV